jgi:hypothetical protein
MTKLLFLMIFFWAGTCPLKADEAPGDDQEFMTELDNIKSPFEDGLPKPVVVKTEPVHHEEPKPAIISVPRIKPVPLPVTLPGLDLEGVIVGEGIHQAIINDQVVPVGGTIKGVQVEAVTKKGVALFFKGKKFFLKVD